MSGVTIDPAQDAIKPSGKLNVAVIEQRGGVEQNFEAEDGERRRAERQHHHRT